MNTSTGADPATMRTSDELADASRSPGFQLAADAKTVNPDLKVSILRWTMHGRAARELTDAYAVEPTCQARAAFSQCLRAAGAS
ncbi:hypothetical protein ACWEF9_18910, partial [Streptomyces sp. NPDC004980]